MPGPSVELERININADGWRMTGFANIHPQTPVPSSHQLTVVRGGSRLVHTERIRRISAAGPQSPVSCHPAATTGRIQ